MSDHILCIDVAGALPFKGGFTMGYVNRKRGAIIQGHWNGDRSRRFKTRSIQRSLATRFKYMKKLKRISQSPRFKRPEHEYSNRI